MSILFARYLLEERYWDRHLILPGEVILSDSTGKLAYL